MPPMTAMVMSVEQTAVYMISRRQFLFFPDEGWPGFFLSAGESKYHFPISADAKLFTDRLGGNLEAALLLSTLGLAWVGLVVDFGSSS